MIEIKIDNSNLFSGFEIVYLEREPNELLGSFFQKKDLLEEEFSKYGFKYISIPDLIKSWSESPNKLFENLNFYFPSCVSNTIDISLISKIDTKLYTEYVISSFSNSIVNSISNGLLISISKEHLFYLPLEAKNIDELMVELISVLRFFRKNESRIYTSFSPPRVVEPEGDDDIADCGFGYNANNIAEEIRERIKLLTKNGHEKLLLSLIFEEISKINPNAIAKSAARAIMCYMGEFPDKKGNILGRASAFEKIYLLPEVSSIFIDKEYRIFLVEYQNFEIKMTPLVKSVYFLFLRHPEGILFKNLDLYYDELGAIYTLISNRENIEDMKKSIQDICNPTENSINEKCSRIKESFVQHFDDDIAKNYYITGWRGDPKYIPIDRELVKWEQELPIPHIHFS